LYITHNKSWRAYLFRRVNFLWTSKTEAYLVAKLIARGFGSNKNCKIVQLFQLVFVNVLNRIYYTGALVEWGRCEGKKYRKCTNRTKLVNRTNKNTTLKIYYNLSRNKNIKFNTKSKSNTRHVYSDQINLSWKNSKSKIEYYTIPNHQNNTRGLVVAKLEPPSPPSILYMTFVEQP